MPKTFLRRIWLAARALRWAILALVAGSAIGVGLVMLQDDPPSRDGLPTVAPAPAQSGGVPWYQAQTPPPTLPDVPDAPIFFEDITAGGEKVVRAYEEALPEDVYVPPSIVSAPKVAPKVEEHAEPKFVVPPSSQTQPRLAIVIDDMGVDRKRSPLIVALPGPLTLSYLTYAQDLEEQTQAARTAGHELMLHMSMEPLGDTVDPGPNVLRTGASAADLRAELDWGLGRFDGYVGVNNHMGSKFTADPDGMAVLMAALKKRGLLFLDSRTTSKTVGRVEAEKVGVPVLERNVFLDHVNDDAEIAKRLKEAEAFARTHGFAIAIGHPRPATIRVLREQLPKLAERGIRLVPLSTLLPGVAVAKMP